MRTYKNSRSSPSGALSYAVSSIFSQPSHLMAFTRVYRSMEIAPLTVIPYKPKLQKPFNRNVHSSTSKPFIKCSGDDLSSGRGMRSDYSSRVIALI
jgi:hypothetical protein